MKRHLLTALICTAAAACSLAWKPKPPPPAPLALPLRGTGGPVPLPQELPPNTWALFRDANGDIRLWCNMGDTMVATDPLVWFANP